MNIFSLMTTPAALFCTTHVTLDKVLLIFEMHSVNDGSPNLRFILEPSRCVELPMHRTVFIMTAAAHTSCLTQQGRRFGHLYHDSNRIDGRMDGGRDGAKKPRELRAAPLSDPTICSPRSAHTESHRGSDATRMTPGVSWHRET